MICGHRLWRYPGSLTVLPHQHRRHNLWLQIVAWTETGCCYEIDGCEFASLKAHSLSGVEHLALSGIVNENLKVLRVFLNHDSQSVPFGCLSMPFRHSSVSLSRCSMPQPVPLRDDSGSWLCFPAAKS
uniref:Uncharacterized protein n=1 Tax=Solibacter usitatus (strain Ellin6076) TaxID=234267 RepID=Q01TN3_SOLUE